MPDLSLEYIDNIDTFFALIAWTVTAWTYFESPSRHCANLYQLLGKPETKLFASLSPEDYKEANRLIAVKIVKHERQGRKQNFVFDISTQKRCTDR